MDFHEFEMYTTSSTPTKSRASLDKELQLAGASIGRDSIVEHWDWDEDRYYNAVSNAYDGGLSLDCGKVAETDISREDRGHRAQAEDKDEDEGLRGVDVVSPFNHRLDEASCTITEDEPTDEVEADGGAVDATRDASPENLPEDDIVGNSNNDNGDDLDQTGQLRCHFCRAWNALCRGENYEGRDADPDRERVCSEHSRPRVKRNTMDPLRSEDDDYHTERGPVAGRRRVSETANSGTQTMDFVEMSETGHTGRELPGVLVAFEGRVVMVRGNEFQAIIVPTLTGIKRWVVEELKASVRRSRVYRTYELVRLAWEVAKLERMDLR